MKEKKEEEEEREGGGEGEGDEEERKRAVRQEFNLVRTKIKFLRESLHDLPLPCPALLRQAKEEEEEE